MTTSMCIPQAERGRAPKSAVIQLHSILQPQCTGSLPMMIRKQGKKLKCLQWEDKILLRENTLSWNLDDVLHLHTYPLNLAKPGQCKAAHNHGLVVKFKYVAAQEVKELF